MTANAPKSPSQTRVVVAMSGGVDSSVAAALIKAQGYETIGITLQLYDYGQVAQRKGACCAGQDIFDAAMAAQKIGIPHYVFNYEDKFKQGVMEDFADRYMAGETPIPCVKCNQTVKFQDLLNAARNLDADFMVTGHYVRRVDGAHGPEMHRGIDQTRDQSYFLFATTYEQLSFLRFPLGSMDKKETRRLAQKFGLNVADKPDSQDICFVPDGDYAKVVARMRPASLSPGDIVHEDGRILGHHNGIIHFTIGQRRGLGVPSPEPLYVVKIDPSTQRVIVGPKESLAQTKIFVKDLNWILAHETPIPREADVRIRSSGSLFPAVIHPLNDGKTAWVELATPEYGVSPGQACVFYNGDRLLGGGWIGYHEDFR